MRDMRSVLIPRNGSNRAILARPASMTSRTPSMVSEVSATLVEATTFLRGCRATAASCSAGGSSPWSGSSTQSRPARVCRSASSVRWIS